VRSAGSAIVAGVACVGLMLAGPVHADSTRFIPWKDPAATPRLALNDLAGRAQTLADYRGRLVLLNFWATWCKPCRDEMTSIRTLQERMAGQPFTALFVNFGESRARVAEFATRESIGSPVLLDPNQDASRAWRVRLLPASFLIDADGRVRYSVVGELDWGHADAVGVVQSLLR
jgi:thiol-disulfide isomerase/thioredoxin